MRSRAPDKIVIYLPERRSTRRSHVDELRRRAKEILELEIPEHMLARRFICFAPGWEPRAFSNIGPVLRSRQERSQACEQATQ